MESAANAGDKNNTGFRTDLIDRFFDGIEYRQSQVGLSTFSRGDAADHIGAIVNHFLRMEGANFSGKTLNNNSCIFVD